jgi:putative cardiolipin synthase
VNAVDERNRGGRTPASGGGLARAVERLTHPHPGESGILALDDAQHAFAARLQLADAAQTTLDVQYYIWRDDVAGGLLVDALRRAADRGVRVRLLLDDNGTVGLDRHLAALDAHPAIAVRLFNPFRFRRWRILGYLFEFPRLNRRMHNKSFTVDRQVTIVGGRNVGDEYFGAGNELSFVDLDVLAIGPVVSEVSHDFERYWTCASARDASRVLGRVSTSGASFAPKIDPAVDAYRLAVARHPLVEDLLQGKLTLQWATTGMLSDDPAKAEGRAGPDGLMWPKLAASALEATRSLDLVSAYFVPGATGTADLAELAARGVRIRIITNALAATDVVAVHAGYARRRAALLAAGIELFEMRRSVPDTGLARPGTRGSSWSSLHAKTLAIDGRRVFVGSFNFDPRSAELNTELGFLIDSPALAEALSRRLDEMLPTLAFAVRPSPAGRLEWIEESAGARRIHRREPGAGVWRRLAVAALSFLPIEPLL